jgi:hypothetical protein
VKLKREILEAQDVSAAHELADILLKLHPDKNSDVIEDKAQELLLISVILAASAQGETCVQFLLDRLKDKDPKQWLDTFQGEAKTQLEGLENMSENYRKITLEALYIRISPYVIAHSRS